jgi:acetoacetyl-CoA synthetase
MTIQPLWTPNAKRAEATNLHAFTQSLAQRFNVQFDSYADLHQWSIEYPEDFWAAIWEFVDIRASKPFIHVVDDITKMPGAAWFEGAELNFAENLLRHRDAHPAIIFRGEHMPASRTLTYAQLYDAVSILAQALKRANVQPGDRVVGFMPNLPETVIAMLAAASLGATWSSCSPDFGVQGVLDRFARIKPKILFTADGYSYGGKTFSSLDKVRGILNKLDSHPTLVVIPYINDHADIDLAGLPDAHHLADFTHGCTPADIDFVQLPFNHPHYIMYSSGTTGLPKCMVQSAGGVLINQLKELILHADVKREDNLFYFTTCGWMMWNWLVCALGTGCTITLFDGSPFHPDAMALWKLAEQERITIFGTSAKYLAAVEQAGARPGEQADLASVKAILSTGSPLAEESFDFVYRDIKSDVCLSSIAGGTDLNGCFVGGNPMGSVYRGEIQCLQLGMDVHAYDAEGNSLIGATGELVCRKAFPSMPVFFWDDPDGAIYHNAYFARYPGVWRHGDFIEITERGGVRMLGRSDATLNPGGVRIGTAELYRQVEPLDEIDDSLVVGQDWQGDVRVILFVKLKSGVELTEALEKTIRTAIRTNCTPRHVPAKIIAIDDIPYTINMKKVEIAVRNIIHGQPVKNRDALKNPDSLKLYENLPQLKD